MTIPFTCPHCGHLTDVSLEYAGQTGPCLACGQQVTIPPARQAQLNQPFAQPALTGKPIDVGPGPQLVWTVAILAGLLIIFAIFAAVVAFPFASSARNQADQRQTMGRLKQLGLAFHNYHDTHNRFPSASVVDEKDQPRHSWRVAILPWIEEQQLFDEYDFNKPWDHPDNLRLESRMPALYRCREKDETAPYHTRMMLITGEETPWGPNRWRSLAHIRDGTTRTLLMVLSNRTVHWMQPDDLPMDELTFQIGPGPGDFADLYRSGETLALFVDAKVFQLNSDVPADTWRSYVTHQGNEIVEAPQ